VRVVLVDQGKACHYFCWPNIVSSSINSPTEKYPVSHWDDGQVMLLYIISLKTCLECIFMGRFMAEISEKHLKFCVGKSDLYHPNLQKYKGKNYNMKTSKQTNKQIGAGYR